MSTLFKFTFATALSCLPLLAWAQAYEGTTCKLPGNTRLKAMLTAGTVDRLETYEGNYGLWATSFLAPSGKAPVKPASDDGEAQEEYQRVLVAWSCQYGPGKAADGDTATAWVEGANGPGVGEVLVVQVNTRKPVRIWSGYGKSPALHGANGRPQKVRVHVLQALRIPDVTQVSSVYTDLKLLASAEATLADKNAYQPLPVPPHTLQQAKTGSGDPWPQNDPLYEQMTFVALEILSVYPGAKYADTAISEVSNGEAN
ncbi:MAG TPA: hypothetical protein VF678_10855 [bacterium]